MARKRKANKFDDLLVLSLIGLIAYFAYPPGRHLATWILVTPAVFMVWISFFMPTQCDYITQRGKPCDRRVRGKLRGCGDHARWKRDAMFAALGATNPGRRFRMTWAAPNTPALPTSSPRPAESVPSAEPRMQRGMYDLVMLACTVLSAVAAVAALFV